MSEMEQRREKCPNQIGKYLVGGIIGKGGFGSVFRALDKETARLVAIKQMSASVLGPGDLGSIEMEINLLSKLKHRNIVKYIDSIRTDQHLNIVLEYIEGGSLAGIVKKFHAIPEGLTAIYTLQILLGLQYLHSQGVVHRDIKGANVLVTKKGTVKLADFGVATKLSENDNSKRCVVGTPYWMAPEIVEMSSSTPACDLWSVGGTVVEMITESPPYFHLPQVSALYRIVSDPHPPLPECISPQLESFLLACWEKNPSLRAGAGELLQHEWIQIHKRHTIDFTRSRKQITSPTHREQEDDDEDPDMDEDAEAVESFMATVVGGKDPVFGQEQSSTQQEQQLGHLGTSAEAYVPVADSALAARSEGDQVMVSAAAPGDILGEANSGGANNVGEYHFFFLEYFQKMDKQRTLGVAASAAAAAVAAATTAAGVADVEAPLQPTPPQQHCYPHPHVPRRLLSRAGSSRSPRPMLSDEVGSGGGDQTPLPPPQESPSVGIAPTLSSSTVAGSGGGSSGHAVAVQTPAPCASAAAAFQASPAVGGQRDAADIMPNLRREEIKQLLAKIKPFEEPETLVEVCKRLTLLLQQNESNCLLVMQYGAVPIVEMLQVPDPTLLRVVLKMVNKLMDGSEVAQEILATVGLIPGVIKFARAQDLPALRREAAHFISRLCNTSARSLQMLVACGGLEAIADLVAHDYYHNRDLVWLALDALVRVFEHADQHGRVNDFCRILAKHGLCGHLCVLIDTLASDIRERAAQYLRVVVDLVLVFAKEGDAIVKVYMAKQPVLEGFISALEFLPQDLSVQLFKTFKWLAQEPSVLNMLENAGVVPVLVTMLASLSAEDTQPEERRESSQDACSQCLLALFYLCKLSRARQEQAALAGAAPVLQTLVERAHGVKVYAFAMLCDLPSASLATRRILWHCDGLGLLVRSLNDPELQTFALEALVGWFGVKEHRADWCERLEGVLLLEGGDFVPQLLALFRFPDAFVFMKVLEQLLKLARLSERLVAALADSDEFFEVSALRLQPRGLHQQQLPSRRASAELSQPASPSSAKTMEEVASIPTVDATTLVTTGVASDGAAEGSTGDGERAAPAVAPMPSNGTSVASGLAQRQETPSVAPDGLVPDDDIVRARKNLLMLLLQICQNQDPPTLGALCVRHELPTLIKAVLLEEQRRHRVILCDFASQLLELFRRALSAEVAL